MKILKSTTFILFLYTFVLIISVGACVYFFLGNHYITSGFCFIILLFALFRLYRNYHHYNNNILFLLDAIKNGDYTFKFSENAVSKYESRLNQMLNQLKDILIVAKQEAIEKEQFLSIVIEDIPIGLLIIDHNNNIRSANQASLDLLGLPVFTHLNQLSIIDTTLPEVFRNLQTRSGNKQIQITKEREMTQISLGVTTIKIQGNDWRIITLNNIGSELETREMESWMKLIRVMTHEIMNSIAPITSLSEMMLFSYKQNMEWNEDLQTQAIEALTTINTTAKGLSSFVDSYRQFSGVTKPSLAPIDLHYFIDHLLLLKRADFESQDIQLIVDNELEDTTILGDEVLLTRVIVNLLKNASEALLDKTDNRQIKLSVTKDNDNKVVINVANNGSPIPQEIAENIFIPFYTTKRDGSGIGLSLSRYILRLHEGNLKYFEDKGWTVFSMTVRGVE